MGKVPATGNQHTKDPVGISWHWKSLLAWNSVRPSLAQVCVAVCVCVHARQTLWDPDLVSLISLSLSLSLSLFLFLSPFLSESPFVHFRVFPSAQEKYWRIESRAGGQDLVDLNRVIPSFAIYPRLPRPQPCSGSGCSQPGQGPYCIGPLLSHRFSTIRTVMSEAAASA